MSSSIKALLLHFNSENRDTKAARLAKSGIELIVEEPKWPRFAEVMRREKPVAVIVDFSRAPRHALETLDYISKSRDGREIELFAIHAFDEQREALKERVPRAQVMAERELAAFLAARLPEWVAARAAAEEAIRLERLARTEERKAASRERARERREAAAAAVAAASPTAPRPAPPAGKPKSKPKPKIHARKPARKKKPAAKKKKTLVKKKKTIARPARQKQKKKK